MDVLRLVMRIFRTTAGRIREERVPEAAASMGFYTVFSLFPLMFLIVAAGTLFLDTASEQERLLDQLLRFLPVSRNLVREHVLALVRTRDTVTWISAFGLLWSSSSAFSILVRNLSRAWEGARPPSLLLERVRALAVIGAMVALVVLLLLVMTVIGLPHEWLVAKTIFGSAMRHVLAPSGSILFVFLFIVMMLLYKWLPRASVLWREAAIGALASSIGITAATGAFTWFLHSGFVRYNVVYGSLGALLALLSWVYIAGIITLSGVHLAAAIAWHTRGTGAVPRITEEE
jgi:membrane protein